MAVDIKRNDEIAETIAVWVPKFLHAREAFITTRKEWGDWVYKMEVLAGEHSHAGDEFAEEHSIEWAKLDKSMSPDEFEALVDRLKAIDEKIKAAKAQVDTKMVEVRRDYVETLLPLYKECNEAFDHLLPCLDEIVKLVDIYGSIHRNDRPPWWDSILEHALRLEKEGKLEEEWEKPFYPTT